MKFSLANVKRFGSIETTPLTPLFIKNVDKHLLAAQLAGPGLGLRFGDAEFRIQTTCRRVQVGIGHLYRDYPFRESVTFPDFRVRVQAFRYPRRSMVHCWINGTVWHSWPERLAVAGLEWVCNWCFFRRTSDALVFHAASAQLPTAPDCAIVMPGVSGAGKSTLASTLMLAGWGLLSDEVSMYDLRNRHLTGLGRPTILKGKSLDLVRSVFGDKASFGPESRLEDPPSPIAHLPPTEQSLAISGKKFVPKAFVFPRRNEDVKVRLERLTPGQLFARLHGFAMNYRQLGKAGFDAVVQLARAVPGYDLHYRDAKDAEPCLRQYAWEQPKPLPTGVTVAVGYQPQVATTADGIEEGVAFKAAGSQSSDLGRTVPVDYPSLIAEVHRALEDPAVVTRWTLAQWDQFYPLATHIEQISRLAQGGQRRQLWARLPQVVVRRLQYELTENEFSRAVFGNELRHLQNDLDRFSGRVVLLKGAAYMAADLPWAAGRRTRDIDLLVRESQLEEAEALLATRGYDESDSTKFTPQDKAYFRRWLHELPPRRHYYRGVEIDLHFRLLPKCDPCSFCTDAMLERALQIHDSRFFILDPVDLVIHAAINLGRTGEFQRAYRDLWDIRCMIQAPYHSDCTSDPGQTFDWQELQQRTSQLKLQRTVGAILKLAEQLVGLQIPEGFEEELLGRKRNDAHQRLMLRTMHQATVPRGPALRSYGRMAALLAMEHYPIPKLRTWFDPLTWTKRIGFMKDG